MHRLAEGHGDGASTARGACPGHRHGLAVRVTETHSGRPRCTRGGCNLQAGHGGGCE